MTMQRRRFLTTATGAAAGLFCGASDIARLSANDSKSKPSNMRLGLVTYNWGKDWDVPTLIKNCEETGFQGVELRSTHKHGVEITIDANRRKEVARQFADSKVELVGLGSACCPCAGCGAGGCPPRGRCCYILCRTAPLCNGPRGPLCYLLRLRIVR